MDAIVLDLAKAQFLVDQAIKQRGEDYKYEKQGFSCLYVHPSEVWNEEYEEYDLNYEDATPGCLVGLAFIKAGVPTTEFESCNDEDSRALVRHLKREGFIESATEDAQQFLYNAQASQDNGHSWGVAVEAANRGKYLDSDGNEKVYDNSTFVW